MWNAISLSLLLLSLLAKAATAFSVGPWFAVPKLDNPAPVGTGVCQKYLSTGGPYKFLSNETTRILAQTNTGDRSRLYAALQRYKEGKNLTVSTIGGSITAGQGAIDAPCWPQWLEVVLANNLGAGGVGAKDS